MVCSHLSHIPRFPAKLKHFNHVSGGLPKDHSAEIQSIRQRLTGGESFEDFSM